MRKTFDIAVQDQINCLLKISQDELWNVELRRAFKAVAEATIEAVRPEETFATHFGITGDRKYWVKDGYDKALVKFEYKAKEWMRTKP